jgi:benzoyl-CoA reductase/2-hydroxyglutaryl-CoA dehydratase subunit BcrC/BadD/HgdB
MRRRCGSGSARGNGWDKFDLKNQMQERGIPILQIDLEYGHPAGAQMKIRVEAFLEVLERRG